MTTRRQFLRTAALGFGGVAADALRAAPHHPARATSVILLYMDGGPSQIDTFDPKPLLAKYDGQDPYKVLPRVEPTQFANVGKVMASPWKFAPRGRSGLPVSDLFPHLAGVADELAVLRGLTSKFPEHTSANYFLHSGSGLQGRPSLGAWVGYGLGSVSKNLPGFVVLNGGLIPPGGLDTFGSGFLPAAFQASVVRPTGEPLANVMPRDPGSQRAKLDLVMELDALGRERLGESDALDAAVTNAETAFRMQTAVPELTDLSRESAETRKLYGCDSRFAATAVYARQCLLARRMVERGVRFVELTCPNLNTDRWDSHSDIRHHEPNARAVDQPTAALLTDLKRRGLLDRTLVVWAGEFGRTPFAQGGTGRDHNPFGFSVWLAGGGAKGGVSFGETDEFGYKAVAGRLEMHDLHATILHLLGIDHTRLTVRHSGRDVRLTDVSGRVVTEVLG